MHLRPGSDIFDKLAAAGIEGDRFEWADPLCEGPLRPWASDRERWRDRAIHLSMRYHLSYGQSLRNLGYQDARVSEADAYREVVLWFEHDLFDQFILTFLLTRLAPLVEEGRVSLVMIDRYPGVERFIGLGQLDPADLAALYPQRSRVTMDQVQAARRVWKAMTAPDPRALGKLAHQDHSGLPYLRAAIARYLAEFPQPKTGLGRTEQWGLEAIAGGAETPRKAFPLVQEREASPYQGDSMFYATLRSLTDGQRPLLETTLYHAPPLIKLRDEQFSQVPLRLTPMGKSVLAGQRDWFEVHGAARWQGGVFLMGPEPEWRYDPVAGELVRKPDPS